MFVKPAKTTTFVTAYQYATVAQLVEHQLPKLRVAGSNPVYRSNPESIEGLALRCFYHLPRTLKISS